MRAEEILGKFSGEDVEGSGQVHPAILNNDLGVGALLLEWQVYKTLIWEKAIIFRMLREEEYSGCRLPHASGLLSLPC